LTLKLKTQLRFRGEVFPAPPRLRISVRRLFVNTHPHLRQMPQDVPFSAPSSIRFHVPPKIISLHAVTAGSPHQPTCTFRLLRRAVFAGEITSSRPNREISSPCVSSSKSLPFRRHPVIASFKLRCPPKAVPRTRQVRLTVRSPRPPCNHHPFRCGEHESNSSRRSAAISGHHTIPSESGS